MIRLRETVSSLKAPYGSVREVECKQCDKLVKENATGPLFFVHFVNTQPFIVCCLALFALRWWRNVALIRFFLLSYISLSTPLSFLFLSRSFPLSLPCQCPLHPL